MNDIKKVGMIFEAVCCEVKTDLAKRMLEAINVIQYISDIFRKAYKVSAVFDADKVLVKCVFEPLSKSLRRYELGLIGSANLAAQLITLYRNNDDIASAEGLVKGLNLLDEISGVDSSVNFIELNFAIRMAIHKIEKLRDSAAYNNKGEI